jgi:sterol desaturase/sphingolipid hydroxylase (fatty acid hydroxylase superfamily)
MNVYHYIVFGMFTAFALADTAIRARDFPVVRHWRTIGIASMIVYLALTTYAPFLWDEVLGAHRIFDLTGLNFWAQLALGFVVMEAGIFAWHRTMHAVTPIWRMHQMHHSAERVDIWGAFYFHPLDMLGWAFIGSLCLVWIVGLTPEATLVVSLAASFCSMFQHSNLRTPRWLGYFITRPESHSMHHQRGVHGYNYGDVPWFDMLFGSFRNPERFEGEVGFHDGSSRRFRELLSLRLID